MLVETVVGHTSEVTACIPCVYVSGLFCFVLFLVFFSFLSFFFLTSTSFFLLLSPVVLLLMQALSLIVDTVSETLLPCSISFLHRHGPVLVVPSDAVEFFQTIDFLR